MRYPISPQKRREALGSHTWRVDEFGRTCLCHASAAGSRAFPSTTIAYVFNRGGVYSRLEIRANFHKFSMAGFMATSFGTTLLAGAYWWDRRVSLEAKASFRRYDETVFFIKYKKSLAVSAFFLLCSDGVFGIFIARRTPNFEKLVGGGMTFLSSLLATLFLIEARKFRAIASAIRHQ